MKQRLYPARGVDLAALGGAIALDLGQAGYEVHQTPGVAPTGPMVVLVVRRPSELLRQTTGHAAALKVWLVAAEAGLEVHVGTDRVEEKAAGAVEWLLATPALVTEGYAAFQRSHLDERVLRAVEAYLAQTSATPPDRRAAAVPDGPPCGACGKPLPLGGRFCAFCGKDAKAPAGLVACACGEELAATAAFCSACGAKVGAPAAPAAPSCVGCGGELDVGARFCPSCGKPQPPKTPEGGATS